jgi:hypothetical protein
MKIVCQSLPRVRQHMPDDPLLELQPGPGNTWWGMCVFSCVGREGFAGNSFIFQQPFLFFINDLPEFIFKKTGGISGVEIPGRSRQCGIRIPLPKL